MDFPKINKKDKQDSENKESPKEPIKKQKQSKDLFGIKRPKQMHILLFFVLLVIIAPIGYVGYNLLRDKEAQGAPVVGARYNKDLTPKIDESEFPNLISEIESFEKVESCTVNLKAATLRVNVNTVDKIEEKTAKDLTSKLWKVIKTYYDKDIYFTNTDESKMYDCELSVYNFIPDETHAAEDQIYIKLTKTGAAEKPVVDKLHKPKDKGLVKEIVKYDD